MSRSDLMESFKKISDKSWLFSSVIILHNSTAVLLRILLYTVDFKIRFGICVEMVNKRGVEALPRLYYVMLRIFLKDEHLSLIEICY